ncbi:hypothetical protein GPECTOR_30g193 [Gonium pectorale]|uniref:Uncharacterized protein n=1 Tax=Gonium pectorale TaxID=33097 RepID=A0A150GE60_GONPE|nr:hypothetical protein GPECTOR_30g193 [Gonium pectorale]|eukprot:KXZ48098.1 hypothetical protein GPECTOR_30g193 [Gonium pectorale]
MLYGTRDGPFWEKVKFLQQGHACVKLHIIMAGRDILSSEALYDALGDQRSFLDLAAVVHYRGVLAAVLAVGGNALPEEMAQEARQLARVGLLVDEGSGRFSFASPLHDQYYLVRVFGKSGYLDVWVRLPSGDGWGIELLCDCDNADEQAERFAGGGRYEGLPLKVYALIDFRGQGSRRVAGAVRPCPTSTT